ncbi:NFkB inhibitor [Brazilian porcupinepox virus 1]|nr:NFkB inhibitor [Brazilian porcupinepox virus 1]
MKKINTGSLCIFYILLTSFVIIGGHHEHEQYEHKYKRLLCNRKETKYWNIALEIIIGVNYPVRSFEPCSIITEKNSNSSSIIIDGYGLKIEIILNDTSRRFLNAAIGVDDDKVVVLVFSTQRLDKLYKNLSIEITCTDMNCGDININSSLIEVINKYSICNLVVYGDCIYCVRVVTDPTNIELNTDDAFIIQNKNETQKGIHEIITSKTLLIYSCDTKYYTSIQYTVCDKIKKKAYKSLFYDEDY